MNQKINWKGERVMQCETCRFWNNSVQSALEDQDTTGRCTINPPTVDFRTGMGFWPFTRDSDGCGAHQPLQSP